MPAAVPSSLFRLARAAERIREPHGHVPIDPALPMPRARYHKRAILAWPAPGRPGGLLMRAPTLLFRPLAIGSLELKNRVVMAPMTTLYDVGGDARYLAFLAERARGGAAMITVNLQALHPGRGAGSPRDGEGPTASAPLAVNQDANVPRLRDLTRLVHDGDCRACAQLAVFTPWSPGGPGTAPVALSPSGVLLDKASCRSDFHRFSAGEPGRPADPAELSEVQRDIARAAVRAVEAGFDAIQLHAASGGLLSQFLSPLTNRRTDQYGGTPANRARMLIETLDAIRTAIGPRVPLLVRINGTDLLPGGMTPEAYRPLVPMLEAAGADAIDVAPGWYETRVPLHQAGMPRAAFAHVSAILRRDAHVPVSANGRITDPWLAERLLGDQLADFIAIGTPLIADPDWPRKAHNGHAADIRPCTACGNCLSDLAEYRRPITCAVNPRAGRETALAPVAAPRPRQIAVVGGGPAGMEAAAVAASRGHRVTLFERRPALGGQLRQADAIPLAGEWWAFRTFLETRLRRQHVDVRAGAEAGLADVLAAAPDAVIVATGETRTQPAIPGALLPHVMTCVEVLDRSRTTGFRVVVVNGSSKASAAAVLLAEQGRHVTVVDPAHDAAGDVDFWTRWRLAERLETAGVRVIVDATVTEITPTAVRVAAAGRPDELIETDTVVCDGRLSGFGAFPDDLAARGLEVHLVADDESDRRIGRAVEAGHRAGLAV